MGLGRAGLDGCGLGLTVCSCAQEFLPLGRLNELEERGLEALKAELGASIRKGVDFVRKGAPAPAPPAQAGTGAVTGEQGAHGPSASASVGAAVRDAAKAADAEKAPGAGARQGGVVSGGAGTGSSSAVGGALVTK